MLESKAKSLGLLSDNVWSYIDKVVAFNHGDERLRKQLVDMHIAKRIARASIDNVFNGGIWNTTEDHDDDCYSLTADQLNSLKYVGTTDRGQVVFGDLSLHDDYIAVYYLHETLRNADGIIVSQKVLANATPMYIHRSKLESFWLNNKYIKAENLYNRSCKAIDSGVASIESLKD